MSDKFRKIIAVVFTLVVFCSFAGLMTAGILSDDRQYSETENRYLAGLPAFSPSSLANGSLMEGIESYLSDQFALRDTAVSLKTYVSRILGKTQINDVYCGKNNRLFEVPSAVDSSLLASNCEAINNFSLRCGIENQYFLLAPNATFIYDNELPFLLRCEDQSMLINSVFMKLSSDTTCVDASSALKSRRNFTELYFRTDHHWTAEAALIAFEELCKRLDIEFNEDDYENIVFSNSFSGTLASSSGIYETADTLSCILPKNVQGTYFLYNADTQEKSASVFDFSKLENKNQYEVFFGGNFSRLVIKTENLNERNLLIFKDSFANCFIPLLIPHFENIVIIDPRYYTDNIDFVLEDTSFTHLLYLYNLNTFLEDSSLRDVIA